MAAKPVGKQWGSPALWTIALSMLAMGAKGVAFVGIWCAAGIHAVLFHTGRVPDMRGK